MELDFINEYAAELNNYRLIFRRLAEKTFAHLAIDANFLIEVSLVDDVTIHDLNLRFRKIDRPTDVLSFAFLDLVEGEVAIVGQNYPRELGTIIISVDRAKAQAEDYQHGLRREMKFLFLHGLLHLLGYDHLQPEQEKTMFALQDAILGVRKVTKK